MSIRFTLTQAARMMGVSRRTLYDWLRRQPISTGSSIADGRAKTLTMRQIEQIAQDHHVSLKDETVFTRLAALETHTQALEPALEAISARLDALEAQQATLDKEIHTSVQSTGGPLMTLPNEQRPPILIKWSSEDQMYIVSFPEYPTIRTHGATWQEALKNAEGVLELLAERTRSQQRGK